MSYLIFTKPNKEHRLISLDHLMTAEFSPSKRVPAGVDEDSGEPHNGYVVDALLCLRFACPEIEKLEDGSFSSNPYQIQLIGGIAEKMWEAIRTRADVAVNVA